MFREPFLATGLAIDYFQEYVFISERVRWKYLLTGVSTVCLQGGCLCATAVWMHAFLREPWQGNLACHEQNADLKRRAPPWIPPSSETQRPLCAKHQIAGTLSCGDSAAPWADAALWWTSCDQYEMRLLCSSSAMWSRRRQIDLVSDKLRRNWDERFLALTECKNDALKL